MRRKLAAGNWKMNGTGTALAELESLAQGTAKSEVLICPPATLLSRAAALTQNSSLALGGQDCHAQTAGAHTGDISAGMLQEAGATAVILGHSERRADHDESNAQIAAKVTAAWEASLTAIVCLGETLVQREAQETLAVIKAQLAASLPDGATGKNTVIAYEPIWAIGTGMVPSLAQIGEVHDLLRAELTTRFGPEMAQATRLLYGGSVKPGNASDIFAISNVDGALVGGASLKATDFSPIIAALDAS